MPPSAGNTQRSAASAPVAAALLRVLGSRDLAALAVNAAVGAGILGLPGKLFALLGSYAVLACVGGCLLIGLIAASFAAAGSRFARTGGSYLFARAAFGPVAGRVTGALMLLTMAVSYAAVANLMLTYADALLPGVNAGFARLAVLAGVTLALAAPVYFGVQLSALAHRFFAAVKFALLLGFIGLGLPTLLRHGVPHSAAPPAANWAPGVVLMIYALAGMEAALISNGEVRNPARAIPRALAASVLTVAAIYGGVLLVSMASVADLGHATRPVYDGARALGGAAAGTAVIAGGCISMLGVMFVIMFALPRVIFGLAEQGQLPGLLAAVHARYRTPHMAVLVSAPVLFLLSCGTSFLAAVQLSVGARLLVYGIAAASALVLQRRGVSETEAPLILPGGGLIPAAAAVVSFGLAGQSVWTILRLG